MAEVDVFDIEIQHGDSAKHGHKNNSDSDDELLEIEEVKSSRAYRKSSRSGRRVGDNIITVSRQIIFLPLPVARHDIIIINILLLENSSVSEPFSGTVHLSVRTDLSTDPCVRTFPRVSRRRRCEQNHNRSTKRV